MATFNELVQTLLAPLVPAGQVFYLVNEAATPAYPYMVWTVAGGEDNTSLEGRAKLTNTRLQLDLFDNQLERLLAVDAALDALIDAGLEAAPMSAALRLVPLAQPQDLYEDAVKAYRRLREFSVWWTRD